MIGRLLSLLSLLSRALAFALTPPALARRRLKKSSIYLSWKCTVAAVAEGSIATATPSDNSDDSDNRSAIAPVNTEEKQGRRASSSAPVASSATVYFKEDRHAF